jgi:hypothetical protein
MISRVNIYFENGKLRRNFEAYSKKHGKSFSETVLEFAGAGFSLFQKTGSLNIDLFMEKVNRLDEAKKEIEFMKGIITRNSDQISKLLGVEKVPTDESNLPDKSEVEIQEATSQEKYYRKLRPVEHKE